MNQKKSNAVSFAVGFLIMLFSGVFYAWSLFRVELETRFPAWSASAASLNFSLFIIFFCLGGLLGGRLTARLGQVKVTRTGAAVILAGGVCFLSLPLLGSAAALWMLYVSYGGLCGLGEGMVYNAAISAVGARFPKAGGLISGALLTGYGLGSLIMGAVVMKAAEAVGFFPAFGGGVLLVVLMAFFGAGALKPGDAPAPVGSEAKPSAGRDYTTAQMLRTPVFWLFLFWVIFMTSCGLMVINSAASIAVAFGAAAIVGMIVSVFNGLSRTGIGAVCDRLGSAAAMAVSSLIAFLAGVFLLIASFTETTFLMVLGLIAVGITYGCAMALNAAVVRERFGSAHYASNFSVATLSGIPASMAGPYVSGLLQDSFGGYQTTFMAMIAFSLVAGVLFIAMAAIERKNKGR